MNLTEPAAKRSILRRYRLIVAVLVGVAAIPLLLWLARIPIAEMAARQACERRELSCRLNITALSPDRVQVRDVHLEADSADPISVDEIELELTWKGLFSPEITFVRAEKPRLTVDARGGQVKVNLLERLQGEPSGEPSSIPIPPFTISDGELNIVTDAGLLRGSVATSGSLQRELRSRFSLRPANLSLNGHSLDLEEAQGEFVLSDGKITGDASISLSKAQLTDLELDQLGLEITVQPISEKTYQLDWSLSAQSVDTPQMDGSAAASEGSLTFDLTDEQISLANLQIRELEGSISADTFRYASVETTDLALNVLLDEQGDGLKGRIGGSASVDAEGALSAKRATITGDLSLSEPHFVLSDASFTGALTLQNASFSSEIQSTLSSSLKLPDPVDQHGELIATSLNELLSDFSTGVEFETRFDADEGKVSIDAYRPVALQHETSNSSLSWQAKADKSWLALTGDALAFDGAVQFVDPVRNIRLNAARLYLDYGWVDGRIAVTADAVRLAEANAGARRLSADLTRIDYRSTASQRSFSVNGGFRFSGPAFGMDLEALQVQGRVMGVPRGNSWAVSLRDQTCMTVSFISADLPDLKLGAADAEICAADQPIFYPDGNSLTGRMKAQALDIPFETGFASGEMKLTSPELVWRLEDGFRLDIAGLSFAMPFEMMAAEGEAPPKGEFGSARMTAGLQTSSNGLGVEFDFKDSDFAYNDLPVRVEIAGFDGNGSIGDGGIQIGYDVLGARVSDRMNPADNALYEPLLTSGSGMLTGQGADFTGRVRLVDRNAFIGTLDVTHTFDGNQGTATLHDGELVFVPNGLQLHDLTERMRGLAVNASGVIRPQVEINWQNGALTSAGDIEIEGLSFSTFRIGQINGLSGTFQFEDLIGLKSKGVQKFTLDELRFTPTIVLADGEIELSVLGPQGFYLERAEWPFVLGEISIEPLLWQYDEPQQLVTVSADNWDLERLLGLFQVPDLQVQGRVSGKFPIEIVDANAYFRNARLTAVDDGIIRYDSNISRSAGQADPYAKMAFDALKNFEYRVLSIGANGNLTGNIVIDMALSGHNPEVLQGQLFNLNISLASDLAKLVHAGSISGSVQAAQDMVVDLVKQQRAAEQND